MARISIVAKRLQEARERAGISQKQLGIRAGIDESDSSPRMSQYETGTHMPSFWLMTRVAAVLQAPVPYFYCEDPELAEFILKFGTLGSEQRGRLRALMAELVETPPTPAQQGLDRPA
jgi:transcriptional regulator with XRE-family HTH domain